MTAVVPPRFVDSHVHFFDRDGDHGLRWSWLEEESGEGHVPDTAAVAGRRFTPVELFAEGARRAGLDRCVHVQAATGTRDGILETLWLDELRTRHGAPHAAIAHVELDRSDAARQLDAQREHSWVRGVRDLGKTSLLADPAYMERVADVGRRGLLLEVICGWRRFDALSALARRCETVIVLEHFGMAPPPGDPQFDEWRRALERLGAAPNMRLKLSGFGLCRRDWDDALVAALIAAGVDAFGVDRCVLGSNWPMDRVASSYPDVVLAVADGQVRLSSAERVALLAANAERLYGLGPVG
jgi:predicted TIM-barrel fold metal-dependent hydrolase